MAENAAAVGDKMQHQHQYGGGRQQWVPDERDGFISWLRGEFAAANAIIDSLCHHLRTTGEPGEYDVVIGCIQQRRYNWTPVLHMQQYFSVAEVIFALQQATWQRQQRAGGGVGLEPPKHPAPAKELRRNSFSYRHGGGRFDAAAARDGYSCPPPTSMANAGHERVERGEGARPKGDTACSADRKGRAVGPVDSKEGGDGLTCSKTESSPKDGEKAHRTERANADPAIAEHENTAISKETEHTAALREGSAAIPKQEEPQELSPVPKSFAYNELCDGKMVNIYEGLKLYEDLLDSSEVLKIVSLANTLRVSGKKGDLQGQTFVASRKPTKGHGKETIQLGTCIYDGPMDDEHTAGSHREKKVEPIPSLLEDCLDRLVRQQITISMPDYCIIDFFNEGEHSQPHMWLLRYGRPLFHVVLTDCDMVFGRAVNLENRGEYRGSLKLSLKAGSLLVLQGRSADVVKRAIPSIRKQRIILTFGKSQLRDTQISNGSRHNSATSPSAVPWAQHSNRPTNLARRPSGPKNFGMGSGSGVLQAPHIRPQQPSPPNGIQPLFVSQTPVSINAVPYTPVPPVPASSGWSAAAPPRKTDVPRLPVPGTGVFLPPTGSGHSPLHPCASLENSSPTNSSSAEKMQFSHPENERTGKANSSAEASPRDNPEEPSTTQTCNGGSNSCIAGGKVEKEEEHSPDGKKQSSKTAAPAAVAAKQ